MASKIVLFDLDRTLLRTNSSFLFGTFLYRKGYFSFCKMFKLFGYYLCYEWGALSVASLHEKVFRSLFYGQCQREVLHLADLFLEEHWDRILYTPAVERLQLAKREGHYTAICSSSPSFLVELVAKRFAVNEWMATHYAVDEACCFHSVSAIVQGKEKAHFVQALAERLEVPSEEITAYTDSRHDLAFLEAVGKKVGVNPDKELRRLCLQNNWEII